MKQKILIIWIFTLLLLVSSVSAVIDWETDPVAFTPFMNVVDSTDGLHDLGPNGFNATAYGGVTFTDPSENSFDFDGVDDYVNYSQSILESGDDFTISLWLNSDDIMSSSQQQFFRTHGTGVDSTFIRTRDGKITAGIYATDYYYKNSGVLSANTWYHVVAVYTGLGDVKLYINSVEQTESAGTGVTSNYIDNEVHLGATESQALFYNGLMNSPILFNREITQTEITDLYLEGRTYNPYSVGPVEQNDSVESTAVIKQVGDVTFNNQEVIVVSSEFNVSKDNTPLYGVYNFNVLTTLDNVLYCESFIDGVGVGNVTRSNTGGKLGSVSLQFSEILVLSNSTTHTQDLVCNKVSGGGSTTISDTVGIGHFLVSEDNNDLKYNSTTFSGSNNDDSFGLLNSFNLTTGTKTSDNKYNVLVVEGSIIYVNDDVSDQELNTYMYINGTTCAHYPRDVTVGGTGSVSVDCIIENVTANTTYQIDFYGKGIATYEGNIIAKGFFMSDEEIAGGTGVLNGTVFSGDTPTKLFNISGGNLNHYSANVFEKVSYSIETSVDTTVDFYVKLINGNNYSTKNFTRDYSAGVKGVLIGQDIIEDIPEDNYQLELWANCGTVGADCTIVGGSSLGYLTDVTSTIFNSFNVTAHEVTNNDTILNFSVIDGDTTYNTTNGLISVFSDEPLIDLVIKAPGYFGRLVEDHNISTPLNVTMYPAIINITSPENATTVNTMPTFSFIFENGVWKGLTCNYYDNRTGSFVTYDSVTNVGSLVNTEFTNIPIYPDTGVYSFYYGCENNDYQSLVYEIFYDITDPIITFVTPSANNDSFFSTNFSLDITITDVNNYDASVNITDPLGNLIFDKNYNTSGEQVYNITDLVNLSVNGEHVLFIEAADGHTAQSIQTFKTNYIPDGVRFNKEVAIYGYNNDYNVVATKKADRYSMSFIEEDENFFETMYEGLVGYDQVNKEFGDPDKFIVETDKGTIDIITGSEYLGHLIVKIGDDYNDWYWVDFENDQGADVSIERLSDNAVIVSVHGLGNYTFNSIGRLNVVNQTVRFYFDTSDISLIATYEENLISGFETTYYLAATLNPLKYDINETKTVTLNIDGTVYNPIENGSSINTFYYYYPFIIPIDYTDPTIIHQWYFETLDKTNATVQVTTGPLVQNIFNVEIGSCNGSLSYPIINFSYYDEVDKTPLMSNMNYDLTFFDGTYNYEAEGFFTGNIQDSICTNLDPANVSYSWNVYGQVTLDATVDNYTTRVFTFSPDSPLLASNSQSTEQELFLIKLSDSQTVEYSWLSSSYELLNGVMRIYRCNNDNTRSLVESVLITGGKSNANIELLTTSYAYDVVVNGQVYREESYNVCHIEASQDITYYVTLNPEQLTPVSGLLFTGCSLDGPDNESVITMRWDDNSYDSTLITACIQGLRSTLGNNVLIFEECSVADNGVLQVTVPDNSNEYTVRGYLTQGNNSGYCNDYVSINDDRDSGTVLDMTGLIMVILLILGIALYYSDNTTMTLSGTALALLLAWIIGITAYDWLTTSSIVAFIVIILYISKGARKK